jgi:UrcA family protein
MATRLCGLCGALLVLGLGAFCATAPVAAQEQSEEITVHQAPYTIHRQVFGRSMARETTTEKISVAKPVSYADLDLSKPADVEKLKQRVRQAAQDACGQLHSRFPQTIHPDLGEPDCVSAATDQAMARLDGRGVAAR